MKREIHGSTSVTSHFIAQAWVIAMAMVQFSMLSTMLCPHLQLCCTYHPTEESYLLLNISIQNPGFYLSLNTTGVNGEICNKSTH